MSIRSSDVAVPLLKAPSSSTKIVLSFGGGGGAPGMVGAAGPSNTATILNTNKPEDNKAQSSSMSEMEGLGSDEDEDVEDSNVSDEDGILHVKEDDQGEDDDAQYPDVDVVISSKDEEEADEEADEQNQMPLIDESNSASESANAM